MVLEKDLPLKIFKSDKHFREQVEVFNKDSASPQEIVDAGERMFVSL